MASTDQASTRAEPHQDSRYESRQTSPQIAPQWQSTLFGQVNVGDGERVASVAAGSLLALLGAGRRDLAGLLIAGVGGGLILRGATGRCPMYKSLGLNTAGDRQKRTFKRGIHVDESFLINKSSDELYGYWRKLENLPHIMSHLKSVQVIDERRSHWVAEAPRIVGGQVEWDAEITADEPNSRIAWRSLAESQVEQSGSVRFIRAPGDRGTMVRVIMDYSPPGGRLGHLVAKLFGESAEQQIRDDLRNFKRLMEVGEILTIEGQPRGTCLGRGFHS